MKKIKVIMTLLMITGCTYIQIDDSQNVTVNKGVVRPVCDKIN